MARITIVGSGIIGLSIAHLLHQNHDITIVARNLPGDESTTEWASPWAGAIFLAGGCTSQAEVKMQLKAFAQLWEWSDNAPESSVRKITMEDVIDDERTEDDIWWRRFMPEFRFMRADELPEGARMGTSYIDKTVVLNPEVFLPWLRKKLELVGVNFKRASLNSLSEAESLGHDVLINATGSGPSILADVRDADVEDIRGQTILVKTGYEKAFMRDTGESYTYVLPRLDGTAIIGGVREHGSSSSTVDDDLVNDIIRRANLNLPKEFSNNIQDYEIIKHNVGLRPGRKSGIRIERETIGSQKVVHAYGFAGSGYIFSFGAAHVVRDLVEDILLPPSTAKL